MGVLALKKGGNYMRYRRKRFSGSRGRRSYSRRRGRVGRRRRSVRPLRIGYRF